MKTILTIFLLVKTIFCFSAVLNIQSVSLINTNDEYYLRVKAQGIYLNLEKIEVSYNYQGSDRHKIDLIFEGCASSNALRNYDTIFQVNSTEPFSVVVYAIWDTSYLCGFLDEPFVSDSVFMSYSELLETLSQEDLLQNNGNIYPNPTNGFVNVDFQIDSAVIYNINYAVIDKLEIISNKLDLAHLKSGFYLIELISQNDKTLIIRILKE